MLQVIILMKIINIGVIIKFYLFLYKNLTILYFFLRYLRKYIMVATFFGIKIKFKLSSLTTY